MDEIFYWSRMVGVVGLYPFKVGRAVGSKFIHFRPKITLLRFIEAASQK